MSDKKSYKTVAIIGGGLIGTSLSLSIKKNNLCDVIKVYDSNIQVRKKLKERLSPNEIYESLEETVFDADLVVLCIPVGSMKEVAKSISKLLKDGCILTDTGSTKNSVIKDVKPYISQNIWFIPSHPLAGTENSGPEAGFPELFKGKYWVIVPYYSIPNEVMDNFSKFLSGSGAITEIMKPEYHDKILAITSHLPHLIAYTIVGTATDLEDQTKYDVVRFSATGFRDFTRIASSDPIMWRDVFLNNKGAVLEMLQRFTEDLTYLQRAIRWAEGDKLEDLFTKTREIRRSIIKEGQDK
ncbi:MAG: cyclohexadienyl dehydrogenase [SAR116 cluster bacterium]|nr:cyclohexadienyl dehydrogenase [SAR116 cluster bacterium]